MTATHNMLHNFVFFYYQLLKGAEPEFVCLSENQDQFIHNLTEEAASVTIYK